ncbi:MAG: alpha/beta hydrolase [Deltaproteobacteria bacterium]|jgi:pimeloyl-ACP methyl ester carboxylesterase|nr:alpha/beta hydrolase [Deltaproteobacteria bacterium]
MMPPPVEERRFVSFDGTEIAYQSVGRGRPILLCNGLGGSWEAWSHQIQYFRDRYRLLCWDYRGLYGSDAPRDSDALALADHARDALQLLREEGVERAAVVGWSMGVQVALEIFRAAPHRVASLALVNGVAGRPWDYVFNLNLVGRLLPPFLRGLRSMPRDIEATVQQATRLPDPGVWVKRVGLAASTFDDQLAGEVVAKFRTLDMDVFIRMLERMGEHDGWDLLPMLDVPVLIIAGSRDVFTPRSAAERMVRRTRGSEMMIIPGATHYAAMEYPEMVNLRLEKFLRERGYEPSTAGAS